MWMIVHDADLLAVGTARKLHTTGSRLLSRCRAALSASPLAPCSPPSGRSPRRAAQGAGCRPDVAPGPPPSPPGCPAGRNPGGAPGSARICTGNRACASRGRPGRSPAPSSRSLPPARERAHNRSSIPRPLPRRLDPHDASGCRGRSPGARLRALARARPRRPGGPPIADSPGSASRSSRGAEGPGVRGRPDAALGRGTGVGARGAAAAHPGEPLGVCPGAVHAAQCNRAGVASLAGMPPPLLALRATRRALPRMHRLRPHHRCLAIVLTGPSCGRHLNTRPHDIRRAGIGKSPIPVSPRKAESGILFRKGPERLA